MGSEGAEGCREGVTDGGMGCVLHLTLANAGDPEGWTTNELKDYNGWEPDSARPWRDAWTLECDGFAGADSTFSEEAIALHHRFYLHYGPHSDCRGQVMNQMWLSAEDGCEGEPVEWRQ